MTTTGRHRGRDLRCLSGRLAVTACLGLLAAACGGQAAARPDPGPRLSGFPRPSDVGVPAGWKPIQTRRSDMVVRRAGATIHDIRFVDADLVIKAPDVTVRRVDMQGGRIDNWQTPRCQNGLVVEDSTFEPAPGRRFVTSAQGATGVGGYTARRVKLWRLGEGFRDGGRSGGCGPVRIEDSFAKISIPPGCPGNPHSDGLQGFDGPPLTVSNVTIDFREADCGTAPFFVPADQGNTRVDVDRLLVMGGGATFRLGVPGKVRGLRIVDHSWFYAPVDVGCSLVSKWDATVVRITRSYRIVKTLRRQRCR